MRTIFLSVQPRKLWRTGFRDAAGIVVVVLALGDQATGAQKASPPAPRLRVTLLGTGTPTPSVDRFGACTLIEAGARKLLFDAGRGCVIRLDQVHMPWRELTDVFLTHLHADHIFALPDVFLMAGYWGGLIRSTYADRLERGRCSRRWCMRSTWMLPAVWLTGGSHQSTWRRKSPQELCTNVTVLRLLRSKWITR
jgi:hypothetical protein